MPPPAFSLSIAEKLTEDNFLLWKQQIKLIIKAHQLHRFLISPSIPSRYASEEDRMTGTLNPEFTQWEQQDSLFLSWLQSFVTAPILTRLIGCVNSWQLWERLHNHFNSKTRAHARMLRTELRNTKKDDRPITEFVLVIVDSLYSIGGPISPQEQLDVILEGLPEEYDPLINLVNTRFEPFDVDELESLLLAHEVRLQKYKQITTSNVAMANVTQVSPAESSLSSSSTPQANVAQNSQLYSAPPSSHFGGGRNGRGRGRGRGRGGRYSIQCQLCKKYGQDATSCWYRFDQNYVPSGG